MGVYWWGSVRNGGGLLDDSHRYHASLLLYLAWVRTSIDLVRSRVLPVTKVQVDIEGVST